MKNKWFAGFLIVFGLFAIAMARQPKMISVVLAVDFGTAGKASYKDTVEIEKGMTPKDLISLVFPIKTGKSCCRLREVISIDGVEVKADEKKWWICLVNGSKGISPYKKKLKSNDIVEWKYIQT